MSLNVESCAVNGVVVNGVVVNSVVVNSDAVNGNTVAAVTTAATAATTEGPVLANTAAEQAPQQAKSKVVPPDNILSDHNELLEQLEEIKSIIGDDPVPPAVFAREPSAADSYISLINAWKEAEDTNVINITPTSVKSVSQVASSLTVGGQWVQQSYAEHSANVHSANVHHVHTTRSAQVMYESDDETQGTNELEDKIDATYNKLCSLEIANADALDAVNQVNGQLENIGRNSFTTSKQVRSTDEKVDKIAAQVDKLSEQFTGMMSEIQCIKNLLISVVRQNSSYSNRNYE